MHFIYFIYVYVYVYVYTYTYQFHHLISVMISYNNFYICGTWTKLKGHFRKSSIYNKYREKIFLS